MGGVFWILLWGWLALPRERIEVPDEDSLLERSAPGLQLKGFRIRQETRYSDGSSTYLDLQAERGWNLEGNEESGGNSRAESHLLVNVEVRLVPNGEVESATNESGGDARAEGGLEDLSERADVAWVLIQAATGIYYFKTGNIDLMGNAQVFGYSLKGDLMEWIATERLFYDKEARTVRSISSATYEGKSWQFGQPYRCFVESDVNLKVINITDVEALGEDVQTPFRNPELRPPYSPPEALRFLEEDPRSRVGTP